MGLWICGNDIPSSTNNINDLHKLSGYQCIAIIHRLSPSFVSLNISQKDTNAPTWVAGKTTWLRAARSGVRIPVGKGDFLFCKTAYTSSGTRSTWVQWITGFFPRRREAEVWNWPPTSNYRRCKEWVERYLYSSYTPSWHGQGQPYLFSLFPKEQVGTWSFHFTLLCH